VSGLYPARRIETVDGALDLECSPEGAVRSGLLVHGGCARGFTMGERWCWNQMTTAPATSVLLAKSTPSQRPEALPSHQHETRQYSHRRYALYSIVLKLLCRFFSQLIEGLSTLVCFLQRCWHRNEHRRRLTDALSRATYVPSHNAFSML